jgi:hypothetical protein
VQRRRECQSIPIERQSIFDLSRTKPGKWNFAFGKSLCAPNGVIDNSAIKRLN